MNQAIQFPDREEWDESIGKIRFPVLKNGMLAECMISKGLLHNRYGQDAAPITLFRNNRWDIEEEFEALIEQGLDNEMGVYELSDDR